MAAETPVPVSPRNQSRTSILIVGAIVLVVAVGLCVYLLTKDNENTNSAANNNSSTSTNLNSTSNVNLTNSDFNTNSTSNVNKVINNSSWKTLNNPILGVSLQIPSAWKFTIASSTAELGQVPGDTRIVSNECTSACNVSKDICEIGITETLMPGVVSVNNPKTFIQELPSYKGAAIAESASNGLSFFRTNVAVTPKGDDGSQGVGEYALFGKTGGTKYFAAALSKGYLNTECIAIFSEVLSSAVVQ